MTQAAWVALVVPALTVAWVVPLAPVVPVAWAATKHAEQPSNPPPLGFTRPASRRAGEPRQGSILPSELLEIPLELMTAFAAQEPHLGHPGLAFTVMGSAQRTLWIHRRLPFVDV